MTAWRLTGLAERQIGEAVAHSLNEYGARARSYQALILMPIADVAADFQRTGATVCDEWPTSGYMKSATPATVCHAGNVFAIRGIGWFTDLSRMAA